MTKRFFYFLLILYSSSVFSAVLPKDKLWAVDKELIVVFVDGTPFQKQIVRSYAPMWLENSHLRFIFFDGFRLAPSKTHIRISFKSHTGSQLGNHGELYSKEPTLLLNQLNQTDLPELAIKRVVLHEFGHALGFEHEYRNPKWPFGDEPIMKQVSDCLPRMIKIGYKKMEARQKCMKINMPLAKIDVNSTIYDEFSIMNYPQQILLKDGSYKQIAAVNKLSVLDKLAIERWYGNKNL